MQAGDCSWARNQGADAHWLAGTQHQWTVERTRQRLAIELLQHADQVLERVRADPAVASGTFVTTITDVVGFFSFLGIATLWFGLK